MKSHPYFKTKLYFFIAIFLVVVVESILEYRFSDALKSVDLVGCCSVIYTDITHSLPFRLSKSEFFTVFLFNFFIIIFSSPRYNKILLFISSVLFLYTSYVVIVYIVSPYIYELPTHQCPYCMLQKDYGYYGYFIYAFLLFATYLGIWHSLFKLTGNELKKMFFVYLCFIVVLLLKPLVYILQNNTFL